MAKRYHESVKDRLAESRGEERRISHHAGRTYMHHDSEAAQEKKDAGMIANDYTKIANLPTEVMMKAYPPCPAYMDWEMEDNIRGIDKQQSNDNAARKRGFQPHKY